MITMPANGSIDLSEISGQNANVSPYTSYELFYTAYFVVCTMADLVSPCSGDEAFASDPNRAAGLPSFATLVHWSGLANTFRTSCPHALEQSFMTKPGALGLAIFLNCVASRVAALGEAWITCEILSVRNNGRHVRWELAEHDGQRIAARAQGYCSSEAYARMAAPFTKAGLSLGAGYAILARVKAQFSVPFGFQLIVSDVDVRHTLGDLRVRLDQIRAELRRSGAWGLQRSRPRPLDFERVVVVAPEEAAGLSDFRAMVEDLARLGLTEFSYVAAPFQGPSAAGKIAARLVEATSQAGGRAPDAVVLVRGGGATSDLAHLTDGMLAETVCRSPVPVIVGIGHSTDSTILDEVAAVSCSTPTAAAFYVREVVLASAIAAGRAIRSIQTDASRQLTECESGRRAAFADTTQAVRQSLAAPSTFVSVALASMKPITLASLESATGQAGRVSDEVDGAVRACLSRAATDVARLRKEATQAAASSLRHAAEEVNRHASRRVSIAAVSRELEIVAGSILKHGSKLVNNADWSVRQTVASLESHARAIPEFARSSSTAAADAVARASVRIIEHAEAAVEHASRLADAVDPATVLAQGYALIRNASGTVLADRAAMRRSKGDIRIEQRDGTTTVRKI